MTRIDKNTSHSLSISFRSACSGDGAAIWRLVQSAGTLELNSPYFYLLFATDFGDTCAVAEHDGQLVGAVIGYHPPREPDTAFVWQVGVLPSCRGQGLGLSLLQAWLDLASNQRCLWVTATVAENNAASQSLFRRLAHERGTRCEIRDHFTPDLFPHEHPSEPLVRIGPLTRDAPKRA